MPGIFISYRRDDSGSPSRRLHDRLSKYFGSSFVFLDVAGIPLGHDFTQVLNKRLTNCEIVIVVIGNHWANTIDSTGRRRLHDPDDFVRLEIEAALHRKIKVIPVLVGGAQMPRVQELPATIISLAYLSGFIIHEHTFDDSVRRLIESIAPLVSFDTFHWWNRIGPRTTKPQNRREYSLFVREFFLLPEVLYPVGCILILLVALIAILAYQGSK